MKQKYSKPCIRAVLVSDGEILAGSNDEMFDLNNRVMSTDAQLSKQNTLWDDDSEN